MRRKPSLVRLSDLPQFTVTGCHQRGDWWFLEGTITKIELARESRSWLYLSVKNSICGDLESIDHASERAEFHTGYTERPESWMLAMTFTWVDWAGNAYEIAAILDEKRIWHRIVYAARDGYKGKVQGYNTIREAHGPMKKGEVLVTGAWDHEHCMICNDHIYPRDAAYHDDDRNWLCVKCYKAYGEPHSLGFLLPP